MDFDALRWQLEVLQGQECHLLGLQQNCSHESRLFLQQRQQQTRREGLAKARQMARWSASAVEANTSLEIAHWPTKVASQVERAKAKAKAR